MSYQLLQAPSEPVAWQMRTWNDDAFDDSPRWGAWLQCKKPGETTLTREKNLGIKREYRALFAAPPSSEPTSSVYIDFKQATELLEMFGDEATEIQLMSGEGHSGRGLYAVYTADPEGSVFLGETDEEALPSQPTPQEAPSDELETPQWVIDRARQCSAVAITEGHQAGADAIVEAVKEAGREVAFFFATKEKT